MEFGSWELPPFLHHRDRPPSQMLLRGKPRTEERSASTNRLTTGKKEHWASCPVKSFRCHAPVSSTARRAMAPFLIVPVFQPRVWMRLRFPE